MYQNKKKSLYPLIAKKKFMRMQIGQNVQFRIKILVSDPLLALQAIRRPAHNQNGVEITKSSPDHVSKPILFLSSQNIIADFKVSISKYNLHY